MKLSPKKQQELYNVISDAIMNARIDIVKLVKESVYPWNAGLGDKVDDILSDLGMKAPLAAIKLFKEAEKKKAPPHPAFTRCIQLFNKSYPDIAIEGAKDGAMINSIIKKLEANARAKGKEVNADTAFHAFAYLIQYAKRTHHFVDGKNLSTWNSKIGEVIHEIRNGKQQSSSPSSASHVRDFASNL